MLIRDRIQLSNRQCHRNPREEKHTSNFKLLQLLQEDRCVRRNHDRVSRVDLDRRLLSSALAIISNHS